MFKKIVFFLALALISSSCSTLRTYSLMRKGKVKQKEFKVEVPFEYRSGLIILKVRVNGEECDFLVDTGAPNLISPELAGKLKLKPAMSDDVGDADDKQTELDFVKLDRVEIGGIDFLNTGAVIGDLEASDRIACLGIDGLLGANLMKEAIWKVDNEKKIITITNDIESLELPEDAVRIPFRNSFNLSPLVDLNCNGHLIEGIKIDMGSNKGISLPASMYQKVKEDLTASTFGFGSNSSGLHGDFSPDTIRYGIVPEVSMEGIELARQGVNFHKESDRIGMEFLGDYTLVFDWFKKELILIEEQEAEEFKIETFGFAYTRKEEKLYVSFIYDQSSAAKSGIVIGDRILKLSQWNTEKLSLDMFCDLYGDEALEKGKKLAITIERDGEIRGYDLMRTNLLKKDKE